MVPGNRVAAKSRRQRAILELLAAERISTQEELVARLEQRGFRITQSTLSRDLKELRVSRQATPEGVRYRAPGDPPDAGPTHPAGGRLLRVTAEEVVRLEANEVSVVLRTLAGRASGVAAFLDSWQHPELLATLAGDDTVMLLPRSVERTGELARAVAELFAIG